MADRELPYDVPPYPCVIFLAETNHIRYDGRAPDGSEIAKPGSKSKRELEYLHYRVSSWEDMEHVNYCREHKGFAVVGHHNLEQLVDDKSRQPREDILKMIRVLNATINPPEAMLAAQKADELARRAAADKEASVKEGLSERAERLRSADSVPGRKRRADDEDQAA